MLTDSVAHIFRTPAQHISRHPCVASLAIVGGSYYTLVPEVQCVLQAFKASASHIKVDY